MSALLWDQIRLFTISFYLYSKGVALCLMVLLYHIIKYLQVLFAR